MAFLYYSFLVLVVLSVVDYIFVLTFGLSLSLFGITGVKLGYPSRCYIG